MLIVCLVLASKHKMLLDFCQVEENGLEGVFYKCTCMNVIYIIAAVFIFILTVTLKAA